MCKKNTDVHKRTVSNIRLQFCHRKKNLDKNYDYILILSKVNDSRRIQRRNNIGPSQVISNY